MKQYFFFLTLLISVALLYSCSNKQPGNEQLSGKWFYTDAPQSYIEFNGTACTEHMGEMGATITYTVNWNDSLHYELKVKEATGPAATIFAPGDKLQVEVKELTKDYYRFYIQGKGAPQCIFVVRQPGYNGPTGKPC